MFLRFSGVCYIVVRVLVHLNFIGFERASSGCVGRPSCEKGIVVVLIIFWRCYLRGGKFKPFGVKMENGKVFYF